MKQPVLQRWQWKAHTKEERMAEEIAHLQKIIDMKNQSMLALNHDIRTQANANKFFADLAAERSVILRKGSELYESLQVYQPGVMGGTVVFMNHRLAIMEFLKKCHDHFKS